MIVATLVLLALQTDPVYQESGGIVVVEIESAPVVPSWASQTSLAGYTGTSYYTWTGADLFGSPGSGILRYRFNITAAGTYNFRIHNRHDFADSTEQNDVFTRLDGGTWVKTYSSQRGQWTWATNHEFSGTDKPPAQYVLSAGVHSLEICGRSHGFSIDRFHLYLPSVTNPLDTSRPQSATTPGTSTPPPAAGTQAVTGLTLINADTDQPIAGFDPMASGAVLNLGTLPTRNLNLRANTSPSTVGSVVFGYDGTAAYHTENGAPYALAGDAAGNFNPWTPTVGSHSASATPYSSTGGTGTAGTGVTVTFTVVDDPATPSAPGGGAPAAAPASTGGSTGVSEGENGDQCFGSVGAQPIGGIFGLLLAALVAGAIRR